MKKIKSKSEKGAIVYFAVLLLGILFGSAAMISTILLQQIIILGDMGFSVNAFYAADSGIEKVLYKSRYIENGALIWSDCPSPNDMECSGPYGEDFLSEDQKYNLKKWIVVEAGEEHDYIYVTSIGDYKGVRRAIQVSRRHYE